MSEKVYFCQGEWVSKDPFKNLQGADLGEPRSLFSPNPPSLKGFSSPETVKCSLWVAGEQRYRALGERVSRSSSIHSTNSCWVPLWSRLERHRRGQEDPVLIRLVREV